MGIFDTRLDLSRRLANYRPQVTTLSDVLYGTPQNQKQVTGLSPDALAGDPLADLRKQASTMFRDSQRRNQALQIAETGQTEAGGWRGLVGDIFDNPIAKTVMKPLEILDYGRRSVLSTVQEAGDFLEGKGWSNADWKDQVDDPEFGFGRVIGDFTGIKWVDRALGLVGDIAFDPLTYLTAGTGGLLRKAGIEATGAAARLALAEKVLNVTGDANKAKAVAKGSISAARKVLTPTELADVGIGKAGLFFFGKKLPAVRVPLSGGLGEAAESAMTRMRLAATSTKVGGIVQKGVTPKWLKEERLMLLRGEVADGEFAEKLVSLNSRNAYRAAAAQSSRKAASSFREALKISGIAETPELRSRMHVLLEGLEQPANATERNALAAWKTAFKQMWDDMDTALKVLDPNHTVGRVDRYFPHLVTDEGRAWLRGGGAEAKAIIESFGLDDLGPTTFFNPRRLKKGSEFFGTVLDSADLNVKRLNEIANNGGFVGEFFDTDILRVAEKYSADYAEQMGRIGAIGHLVENGTITHIEQKLEFDPDLAKAAQREYQTALGRQMKATVAASEASAKAAKALENHFAETKKIEQRLLTASAAEAKAIAVPVQKAQKELDDAISAFDVAKRGLEQEKDSLRKLMDPSLDHELFTQVEKQYEEIIAAVDDAAATYRQYQQLQSEAAEIVGIGGQQVDEARKLANAKAGELNALTERRNDLIGFQQWLGSNYEALVNGAEDIAPHGINGVPSLTFLRTLFGPSHDAEALKQFIGKAARTEGEFGDFLESVLTSGTDEGLVDLLGSAKARSAFSKMTISQADEILRSSGMNAGGLPTIVAGSVRIAQVLYSWGGRANVPEYMLKMLDDAEGALRELRDLRSFQRMVAEAPRQKNQYERLLQRFGATAEEIEDDLVQFGLASKKLDEIETAWAAKSSQAEVLRQRLKMQNLKPSQRAEAMDALVRAEESADRVAEQMSRLEAEIHRLENKTYTVRDEPTGKAQKLVEIAREQLETSADPDVLASAEKTIKRLTPKQYKASDLDVLAQNAERVQTRSLTAEAADAANASLLVDESRRVPMSAEQRRLREQIKRGIDARNKLATEDFPDTPTGQLRKAQLEKIAETANAAQKRLDELPSEYAPWKVSGKSAQDIRHDALYKMEEFVIAADVAQRFAALTDRLAAVGMETSEKMLDDIMRTVRTSRMEKWMIRSAAYDSAARRMRDGVAALTADMNPDELRAAVYKIRSEAFESLGDDAPTLLGPRAQWIQDPQRILDEIEQLDAAVNKAPKGSPERAAALANRQEYYATVAKTYYRDVNVGLTGKVSMPDAKRAIKRMASEVKAGSLSKATKALRETAEMIEKEAAFSRRLKNLYRQIDDVDYSAMEALQTTIGGKQATPRWKATAHEAAAAAIERRIESLRTLADDADGARATMAQERLATSRKAQEAAQRVAAEKETLAEMQARVQAFEASPQVQVAREDQQMMRFLKQFVNVDGWRMTDEDWSAIGLQPKAQFDPEKSAVLQGYIDSRLRDGQKTYVKRTEMVKVVGDDGVESLVDKDVYVPVSRADDVRHGEKLYGAGEGWQEITAAEAATIAGWTPQTAAGGPVRPTEKILQDLEEQFAVAQREVAGREDALRRSQQILDRADADPNFVIRRPMNVPKRVQQIDNEIRGLSDRVNALFANTQDDVERQLAFEDLQQQIEDLAGERQRLLNYKNRGAGAEEVFGRRNTEAGVEGTVEYNIDVPLASEMTEVVPVEEVRAAVNKLKWDVLSKKQELERLGKEVYKQRSFDALAKRNSPPPTKGLSLDEFIRSNSNLKSEVAEIETSMRVGATASDRPVLDEAGNPTGLFESDPVNVPKTVEGRKYYRRRASGAFEPLPMKDPRKAPEPMTFTRGEWESLFSFGLDDFTARRRLVQVAADAGKLAKSIEKQIASARTAAATAKGKITRLEKKLAEMPAAVAGRAGRPQANARALIIDEIDSLRAVVAAHQDDIARLNYHLEEATQAAQMSSRKVRASAVAKLQTMFKSFHALNPNGFDDAAYKASQSVLTDGRFGTVSDLVVTRRTRVIESGWSATPSARVIKQLDLMSDLGVTAVGVANARKDITLHINRLKALKGAAEVRFARAVEPISNAAEDLAQVAGVPNTPNILGDAAAAAAKERSLAAAATKQIGSTRKAAVGQVDPEFIARTVDDLVPSATAAKAEADAGLAAAQADAKALGAEKAAIDKATEAQLKALQAADAAAVKQIDEVVRKSGDAQAALVKKRAEAAARVGKAQVGYDKRATAGAEAAWKYTQAKMDAAYAVSQSNLPERAADAARARAALEAVIYDKDMLAKIRSGKVMGASRRKELLAESRLGAQAKQRVLLTPDIPDKELVKLERAIQRGEKADKLLAAADASDDQAIQMIKVYKDALDLDSLPPNDPLRAVLSDAVTRETELLAAQDVTAAAEYWMLNNQAFSAKLVDDIKKGWTSLSDWGLPSLQSSETLKEMFDNISRVQNPSLLGELNQFLSRYTRFFKTYATLSVGFHIRNAMSNTLMVFGAGADVGNMARGMKLYEGWLTAEREGGDAMRHFLSGLEKNGQRETFEAALRATDAAGGGRTMEMFADTVGTITGSKWTNNWLTRGSRRFGERVEGSGRFMLAYDSVVKGADFNQATARVKRYLFDYMDTSSLDASVQNIIPFWIWMSRNFPLQIVNQWQNPKMYAMYANVMRNVSQPEDGEIVPSWMKETGAVKIADGLYLAPDTGFNRLGQQAKEFTDPARLGSYVNPLLRLPVELLGKRKLYNDTPFSERPKEVTGGLASPVIEAMLTLLGQTDTTSPKGVFNEAGEQILAPNTTVTSDRWNYALMNLLPMLAQSERLVPATEDYKARQATSILNYLGIPLRQLTPQMEESEVARRERAMQQLATQAKNLGYTP
jgi:hypothetical protein